MNAHSLLQIRTTTDNLMIFILVVCVLTCLQPRSASLWHFRERNVFFHFCQPDGRWHGQDDHPSVILLQSFIDNQQSHTVHANMKPNFHLSTNAVFCCFHRIHVVTNNKNSEISHSTIGWKNALSEPNFLNYISLFFYT